MSGEVRLRRATLADAAAAAEVWVRARHQAGPAIPPSVHSDDDMRRWFSEVVIVETDVWLAESDDGLVVGVMALKDGWVEQLYVDASWTGRGIGSRLIQLSKELHPDGLELWTFVSNARACHFYERHGFVALEQTDGRGNEEHAPDVHYAWPARQSGSHGESQDVIV